MIESHLPVRLLDVAVIDQNGNFSDNDIHLIFTMLTGSRSGYTTLFNLLEKHWDTIKKRFEGKPHLWTSIVQSATGFFNTKEDYVKVQALYKSKQKEFGEAESSVTDVLEKIENESQWIEKNVPEIEKWLNKTLSNENLVDDEVREFWKNALACPTRNGAAA